MNGLVSALLWTASWIHFAVAVVVTIPVGALVGQRRMEGWLRIVSSNIVLCAGARVRVRLPADFDPDRACFFVANHVNLLDPFVIHSVVPGRMRGLELESHFKIPFYGWLMKWLRNVPVPEARSAAGLKRTYRLARETLEGGTSLVGFAEGTRTRDGRVGPFEDGVFRMARVLGYPIVPVSLVGAFRWHPTGTWRLRPGTVVVHVHPCVEVAGLGRAELRDLSDRVRAIVAGPVERARAETALPE